MKRIFLTAIAVVILLAPMAHALDIPFSDHIGNRWQSGIEFVYNHGIVQGYPDGTYKPNKTLNRAELLKIIVASSFDASSYNSYDSSSCFSDISAGLWYTKYICFAKNKGIVQGYSDDTFKPDKDVNFVEALKIMFKGMDVSLTSESEDPWYQKYYNTADDKYLVPYELQGQFDQKLSRAQTAEVIMRILSLDAGIVQPPFYQDEGGYEPGTIYLGYLQNGSVLDLYLIADSSVSDYNTDKVSYGILNNNVADFRSENNLKSTFSSNSVNVSGSIILFPGEILHVGTAYLKDSSQATVVTE